MKAEGDFLKKSDRAEGDHFGTDAHFSARFTSAKATRVSKGPFVILPLGTSPIYTH